jgi:MEDS: MEthanogen/methylotroph, DcmR Sensory domain
MHPVAPAPILHRHAVQFYGNEESLFTTVAGFLGEGLVSREPAIIIATPEHCAAIERHLRGRLIDCNQARRNGDLVMLDAEEMLGQFMIGDVPDPELFEETVGLVVQQMLDGRGRIVVRAYGEMVDVLWKEGRTESAIKLEILWNKLALKYSFALLCGYAMGNFYKQPKQLDEVCAQHTHVTGPDNVIPFDSRRVARPA